MARSGRKEPEGGCWGAQPQGSRSQEGRVQPGGLAQSTFIKERALKATLGNTTELYS